MKTTIQLFEHSVAFLILKGTTGVFYSNQTNGTSCSHPEVEGALLPLGDATAISEFLSNIFSGYGDEEVRDEHILAIQDILHNVLGPDLIVLVDRELLDDSHEAWVHVIIDKRKLKTEKDEDGGPETTQIPDEDDLRELSGTFPMKAVLTWSNSD